MSEHPIYSMPVAEVYPHYVTKAEKKGRTQDEVDEIITWLTGYSKAQLNKQLNDRKSFREFFDRAPKMNKNRRLIKGVICGIRVEEVEEPLMQEIRYMDKLVDELSKGKAMEKILRTE
jgi:hypothetical protein